MIAASTDYLASIVAGKGFVLDRMFDFDGSMRFCRADETGIAQFVSWFGNLGGGQIILAVGDVPKRWPLPDTGSRPKGFKEARSPFFFARKNPFAEGWCIHNTSEKIAFWLDVYGIKWLDDPDLFSDAEWAEGQVFTGTKRRDYWTCRRSLNR